MKLYDKAKHAERWRENCYTCTHHRYIMRQTPHGLAASSHCEHLNLPTTEKYCDGCLFWGDDMTALQDREQPRRDHLTQAELVKMDGLPVYGVGFDGHAAWLLISADDGAVIGLDSGGGTWPGLHYDKHYTDDNGDLRPHKLGWVAYLRKPADNEP